MNLRLLGIAALLILSCARVYAYEVVKESTIADTSTTILGLNHIGLSVTDLDQALEFYQTATGFELVRRETVAENTKADALFAHEGVTYEIAVLKAPNMMFELIEFEHNDASGGVKMPPQGPGITHTCFQSFASESGYTRFIQAGAQRLSRGDQPVDLGGYGVTYAYAYDPDGNMLELEQLDGEILKRADIDEALKEQGITMWMSQVGIATHDFERLMTFYQDVLGIHPFRVAQVKDNEKADAIADVDKLDIVGGWFKLNKSPKVIEVWQYNHPKTLEFKGQRVPSSLGYSFSLEVADIEAEYQRLSQAGVEFFSTPIELQQAWQVYARDIDGNIFSLRQIKDPDSKYSVRQLDAAM